MGADRKTDFTALATVIGIALATAAVTKGDVGTTVSVTLGSIAVLLVAAGIRVFRTRGSHPKRDVTGNGRDEEKPADLG